MQDILPVHPEEKLRIQLLFQFIKGIRNSNRTTVPAARNRRSYSPGRYNRLSSVAFLGLRLHRPRRTADGWHGLLFQGPLPALPGQ
ncbi:hypothetical protein COLO4_01238 [Corchorus olitorius]|uniref:Uncharacterized protein n=1 Tax=Corchorus olitorius TaxID=93759 RepID=A0A1R3L2S7_9ROSI|nr:hypothetical protein COLO4_01238 [Corchorus olitorius]